MKSQQITLRIADFIISGFFSASKSKFQFDIESMTDAVGNAVKLTDAQDDGFKYSEMDLAMLAGAEAGIDYATLCEMTWLESRV